MGLASSLNAGVMGLAVNATKLNTISDNIANSETFGYKRAGTQFTSLVTSQSSTSYTAGGVRSSTFKEVTAEGALLSTNNSTDISVSGAGLLPVTSVQGVNASAGDRPLMLTATGSFVPDKSGMLRTLSGLYLMGWPANSDGTVSVPGRDSADGLEPIDISKNQFSVSPTTEIDLGVNLPASETSFDSAGLSYDLPIAYFDNLGTSQTLSVNFTPNIPATGSSNTWRMTVYDLAGNPTVPISEIDIEFNDTQANGGSIESVTNVSGGTYDPATGLISVAVGGAGDTITINIGRQHDGGPLTQLSSTYSPVGIEKDGAPIGSFNRVEIDENGFVQAIFDNGFRRTIYQVPVANVPNMNGLTALENQSFSLSQNSGAVFFWDAGTGPVGTTVGFSLAESTTDIAEELTQLIQTQRAYTSNAKIVQTVDEMLQETTNLKR